MRHFTQLCKSDMARADRVCARLEAKNRTETVRRCLITVEALLQVQDNGGELVLCRKGQPDKVVWIL